ncbi:MAG: D-amino acid aminotransferase [Cycloclasticus sp. symbiont of Bathymodiolus heckerae]|nr:MAG: D-amino acid aminotransferase [Cycloclasticus sp. symbiont of Bathymodiolus heckerae]
MSFNSTVFLNGDFLPLTEAKVSVLDRGFLFADGVYEVIPAYAGKLFRLQQHLDRLNSSLSAIRMPPVMSDQQWTDVLTELVEPHSQSDQSVYVQVTRGAGANRDHQLPSDYQATTFAMCQSIVTDSLSTIAKGISAITLDDIRWDWCHIKSVALLGNILLKQQASDQNCTEAILLRDGFATEGSASNLFIVKNKQLITPPKSHNLLPGITRDLVLELAIKEGIDCIEREISEQELFNADEIWLTSSTKEIMPVIELNRQAVGNGQPGSFWQRVSISYSQFKETLRAQ